MARGEGKLATQIGEIGYYGKVTVEAVPEESDGEVTVDFDPAISSRWKSGATFGIDYALDHLAKRSHFPNGGRVRVVYIGGHDVDTNDVVIAYVAAHAVYKALGIQPTKQPAFDGAAGTFTFPK